MLKPFSNKNEQKILYPHPPYPDLHSGFVPTIPAGDKPNATFHRTSLTSSKLFQEQPKYVGHRYNFRSSFALVAGGMATVMMPFWAPL